MPCIPLLDCVGFLIEIPKQVVICRMEKCCIGLSGDFSRVNDHLCNKYRLPSDDRRAATESFMILDIDYQ
jgi:hypothetical protein